MSTKLSADLAVRARINETIKEYFRPGAIWTPAMGALLVSGVLPTPGCTEIPVEAPQLANMALPATVRQLDRAREVLENWNEVCIDAGVPYECYQESMPLIMRFLLWCDDWYESDPESRKPEALKYILAMTWPSDGQGRPDPAPLEIVERAFDLDRHAAIENERSKLNGSDVTAKNKFADSASWYAHRVKKLMLDGHIKAEFAQDIAVVLDSLDGTAIFLPQLIWMRLAEMCEKNELHGYIKMNKDLDASRRVKNIGDNDFVVWRVDAGWVHFKKSSLDEWLRRNREKLIEGSPYSSS